MRTYCVKEREIERKWWLVNAEGKVLGRLASRIAHLLRGKHKAYFSPHMDCGDFVVVTNAKKIYFTGRKRENKMYYRHSGYPGGLKVTPLQKLLEKKPEEVLRLAVRGMLPKNRLGRKLLGKLKIYAGPDHPHQSQRPSPLEFS
ncbi:50S ribosomal protein L13 [candidate division TA06 bacterium DG_26]|uniref:Large ribosomal subunit protein uL13 n=1 Tax=candidate division TA06 bacterium DG_26 TaxID=1703771 RepID=A0A0S7WLV1_UNCT6|nr:MAG: 50S ribosomal protein L13 [candidate division TA06 bacterium DG_26]